MSGTDPGFGQYGLLRQRPGHYPDPNAYEDHVLGDPGSLGNSRPLVDASAFSHAGALLYAHAPGCDGYACATFSHRHSFGDAHAPGRDTYTHSDDTGHRHTARCHRHECPIRRHLRQRPDRG